MSGDNLSIKLLITHLKAQKSQTNTTSLVTLYVPSTTKINDLSKMINSEISKTSNIKLRQTRQGVQDALQAVSTNIKKLKEIPTNGLAIFTGHTSETFESISIEPPRPIDRFIYLCDNKFCL